MRYRANPWKEIRGAEPATLLQYLRDIAREREVERTGGAGMASKLMDDKWLLHDASL